MIVADTNLIAYFFLNGEHTALAQRVFEHDPDWAAPVLWRSEFRSVLRLYLQKGVLAYEEAVYIADRAGLLMEAREYDPVSSDVLALVSAGPCSAYDCEFVSIARRLDAPLVTFDRGLVKHFPDIAVAPSGLI